MLPLWNSSSAYVRSLPRGSCRRLHVLLLQGFQLQQSAGGTSCARTGLCKCLQGRSKRLSEGCLRSTCTDGRPAHKHAQQRTVQQYMHLCQTWLCSMGDIVPIRSSHACAAAAQAPPLPTFARSAAPTPVGSGCQVANCVACRGAPTNCYLCKPVSPRRRSQLPSVTLGSDRLTAVLLRDLAALCSALAM